MMQRDRFCCVCEAAIELFGNGLILNKYNVRFFRCPKCGFIQTENPYWLQEAYSTPIVTSDVGYVSRNVEVSRMARAIVSLEFDANASFLDYGGGYGMFVRLMRDAGFDFYRHDPHCENLFAQGFDLSEAEKCAVKGKFELLTAFEVFEHLVDPIEETRKMLEFAPAILFSTTMLPEPTPPLGAWWYYGLDHGQHVSFYTSRALELLAGRFHLHLATDGQSLHLLSSRRMSQWLFKKITTSRVIRTIINRFRKRLAHTEADFVHLKRLRQDSCEDTRINIASDSGHTSA